MSSNPEKFLIQLRASSVTPKPQNKTMTLGGQPWDLFWSTHVEIPMEIDYFNVTVGRYIKSDAPAGDSAQKKIEEYWRVTHIPQGNRKITYGVNPADATSTPPKPLEDGIYVIKITGMTTLAAGLEVQTAVGLAVIKLTMKEELQETEPSEIAISENPNGKQNGDRPKDNGMNASGQAAVTGKTLSKIFDVLDEEENDSAPS